MTIEFSCPHCQKNYRLKDELAGKVAKCAKCGRRLKVPALAPVGRPTSEKDGFSQPAEVVAAAKNSSFPESGGKKCSACGDPLTENAVICVACGFDLRSGKKLATEVSDTTSANPVKITIDTRTLHSEEEKQALVVWIKSLHRVVESYLDQYAGNVISGDVVITVQHFRCAVAGANTFSREVGLSISGKVAGERKEVQMKHTLHLNPLMGRHQLIYCTDDMEKIRDVVKGRLDKSTLTAGNFRRDPFFSEVSTLVLEKVDELLGRNKTPLAKMWRNVRIVVWLTSIACGTGTVLFIQNQTWEIRLAFGFMALLVAALFTLSFGACLMPASFFDDYGAGRRFMRLAGTETGQQTQTRIRLALLFAVISIAINAYVTWTTSN